MYRNDFDHPDSDEDIFYPTTTCNVHGACREDIDRPRRGRDDSLESALFRDDALSSRGQSRDRSRNRRDGYIVELHESLVRQETEIRDLNSKLRDLRGEIREYFTNLEQKLTCFEEKVDLVINLVSSWVQHLDRRCRGFCSKHVRTDKCLCRGLKEPHRCCGRISGICDC